MTQETTSTRQRIIDAAFKLFTERGIDQTTTREIAQAAEVNEVTLFRHFGNKEGIARAAVEHAIPGEALPHFSELPLSGNLAHDLDLLTRKIIALHEQRRDFFRFCFANIVQHSEQREFFLNMQKPLFAWLTDFFAPHCKNTKLDAEAMAHEFIGPIVMRSIRRHFLDDVLIDEDRFVRHHATIIATALKALQEK